MALSKLLQHCARVLRGLREGSVDAQGNSEEGSASSGRFGRAKGSRLDLVRVGRERWARAVSHNPKFRFQKIAKCS